MVEGRIDPQAYPTLARMAESRRGVPGPRTDRAARFEFGLARVLDGLDAFIRSRQGGR